MAPSRTQLQGMVQKSEESFKEYTQRWCKPAARVQPPLLDRELIDLFMGTLRGPYLQHMLSSTSTYFSDMVIIGEHVEMCIKAGTIQGVPNNVNNNAGISRKPFSGFVKKKEGETNAITINQGRAPHFLKSDSLIFLHLLLFPTNLFRKYTLLQLQHHGWPNNGLSLRNYIMFCNNSLHLLQLINNRINISKAQELLHDREPLKEGLISFPCPTLSFSHSYLLAKWFNCASSVHRLILSLGDMILMLIANSILVPQAIPLRIAGLSSAKFKISSMLKHQLQPCWSEYSK